MGGPPWASAASEQQADHQSFTPPAEPDLQPALLLGAGLPLAPLHRIEDLLRLALGETLAPRLAFALLLGLAAAPGRRRCPATAPTASARRRRTAAIGQLEVPLGPGG